MVEVYVNQLARDIAERDGMIDPLIEISCGSNKGDGFLGEIYTVTVRGQSNKELNLILKSAMTEEENIKKFRIKELYENELHIYTNFVPSMQEFQANFNITACFNISKYYDSYFHQNIRIIAIENMKTHGFELASKTAALNGDHIESVFARFGKLHAFSFSYKYQHPNKYKELTRKLQGTLQENINHPDFAMMFNKLWKETIMLFEDDRNEELKAKLKKYSNADKLFKSVLSYEGKYFVVTHGDAWSNNVMFKYSNQTGTKNIPEDVCLLDWQMSRVGTPVFDLSHFLYSSSRKEVFDDLGKYLSVYYHSLATTIRKQNDDPDILYPYAAFKADWEKYSKFGLLVGVLSLRLKFMHEEDVIELSDMDDQSNEFFTVPYNQEQFEIRVRELVLHMYEVGTL